MSELDRARAAKVKALTLFSRFGNVVGIGISRERGDYVVKVNIEKRTDVTDEFPAEIDGVRIVVDVVGRIRPLAGRD